MRISLFEMQISFYVPLVFYTFNPAIFGRKIPQFKIQVSLFKVKIEISAFEIAISVF